MAQLGITEASFKVGLGLSLYLLLDDDIQGGAKVCQLSQLSIIWKIAANNPSLDFISA